MRDRIMLFVFIIYLGLSAPLAASNASQEEYLYLPDPEATISMDFKDANLKDVLKVFSIQSGLNFISSESVQDRKITLYLEKVPVQEAIDMIFRANNLAYEIAQDSNIFIVKEWGKPKALTVTKVFNLKYATVGSSSVGSEIANQLRNSLSTSASGTSSSTSGTGSTSSFGSGNANSFSAGVTDIIGAIKSILSKDGKISEDARTNSIIVTDSPDIMPIVEEVVAKLDVPVPQVVIDVEMLDVNKNVVDQMGLEFSSSPFTFLAHGHKVSSFMGNVAYKGAKFADSTPGVLALGGVYGQALEYLRTQTDTKYLARPKLLTLNNQTAEISVTKDEVVGRKSTTTTGTSTTTSEEFIRSTDLKLTEEGTGIFLRVTPQINLETNEITMVINPKTSITSASAIDADQADAEVRSTKSIVKVKDGETVALGGLIHQDKGVTVKKLPILSDIPILGALFRHKDVTKDQDRELLVFITPHIVKDQNNKGVLISKGIALEREQSVGSAYQRSLAVNSSLDRFERVLK